MICRNQRRVLFNACDVDYDVYLRIYNSALTQQLAYRDDGGCGTGVSGLYTILTEALEAGTYNLVIEGWSRREGNYNVSMSCSPATTTPAPGPASQGSVECGQTVSGNTLSGSHSHGNPAYEHRYTLTLTGEAIVTFNACEADFDIYLRLYRGVGTNTQIQYRDDGGCGTAYHPYRTKMISTLLAGDYDIMVEGYWNNNGNYNLTVSCEYITTTPLPILECPSDQWFNASTGVCEQNSLCNIEGDHTNDLNECFRLRDYFTPLNELAASAQMSRSSADSWREVAPLDGSTNMVSLESCKLPGHYLTRAVVGANRGAAPVVLLLPQSNHNRTSFAADATWIKETNFLNVLNNHRSISLNEMSGGNPVYYRDPSRAGSYLSWAAGKLLVRRVYNWNQAYLSTFAKIESKIMVPTGNFTSGPGYCRGPGYSRPATNRRHIGVTTSLGEALQRCRDAVGCNAVERRSCRNWRDPMEQRYNCQTYLFFHSEVTHYGTQYNVECHILERVEAGVAEAAPQECPTVTNAVTEAQCHYRCAFPNGADCGGSDVMTQHLVAYAKRANVVLVNTTASNCMNTEVQPLRAIPGCYEQCFENCVETVAQRPERLMPLAPGQQPMPFTQDGFCVDVNGRDVNHGLTKHVDPWISQDNCIEWCMNVAGRTTGCEHIINQWNRGCYVFTTSDIHHGNNVRNHKCWIFGENLNGNWSNTPMQQDFARWETMGCFRMETKRWGLETRYTNWVTADHMERPGFRLGANGMQNDYEDSTFRLRVPVLASMGYTLGQDDATFVSLESCENPGTFLIDPRRGSLPQVEGITGDINFALAATWKASEALFPGWYSLQSVVRPNLFLRGNAMNTRIQTINWNSDSVVEEASWRPVFDAGEVVQSNFCENHWGTLSCGLGYTIDIVQSWYGRRDNHTCYSMCPLSQYNSVTGEQSCRFMQTWLSQPGPDYCSANTTQYVVDVCQGQTHCDIRGQNRIAGDPCWYTYKYIHVEHRCVPDGSLSIAATSALVRSGPQEYISVNATATSDRSCVVCGNCTAPSYVAQPCTEFTPTQCAVAVFGETWVPVDNMVAPIPTTQCPENWFETTPPTLTSNRACTECRDCPAGEVLVADCNATTQRQCAPITSSEFFANASNILTPGLPVTHCVRGWAEYQAPTLQSDRTCVPCEVGVSFSANDDAEACVAVRARCDGVRTYEIAGPTSTSDRVCTAVTQCNATQFTSVNATEFADKTCTDLAQCNDRQFIAVAATPYTNRVCANAAVCGSAQWMVQTHTTRADTVCANLTECDFATQWESHQPDATSDRQCRNLTACSALQFVTKNNTQFEDRECGTHDVCEVPIQYEASPASQFVARTCAATRVCSAVEYETVAPTTTSNRACELLTTCTADQFIAVAHTSTSNRQCGNLTVCDGAVQYESVAATGTSDRTCSTLTVCNTTSEWESGAAQYNVNRECSPLTVCNVSAFYEYEQVPAGPSNNRVCVVNAVCDALLQFELVPPTTSSARLCQDLAQCGPNEYMSVENTYSTDRACTVLTQCSDDEWENAPPQDWTVVSQAGAVSEFVLSESLATTVSTRFLRFDFSQGLCTLGNAVTVYEIEVLSAAGGAAADASNVAVDKPVFASSERNATDVSYAAVNVVDGDTEGTFWTSDAESSEHHLIVDLEQVTDIATVRVYAAAVGGTTPGICNHKVSRWTGSDAAVLASVAASDQWVLVAAEGIVPTVDRICEPLTECSSAEFEVQAPSAVSNRECQELTVCDTVSNNEGDAKQATQYILEKSTGFADRECAPLSQCVGDETEEDAPTDASDRVCKTELQLQAASAGDAESSGSSDSQGSSVATMAIAAGVAFVALIALVAVTRRKNSEKPPDYIAPVAGAGAVHHVYADGNGAAPTYEAMYDGMKIGQDADAYAAIGGGRRPSDSLEGGYMASYNKGSGGGKPAENAYGVASGENNYGVANGENNYGVATGVMAPQSTPDDVYDMGASNEIVYSDAPVVMAQNTYDVGGDTYVAQSGMVYDVGHAGETTYSDGPVYGAMEGDAPYAMEGGDGYSGVGTGAAENDDDTYDNNPLARSSESNYGMAQEQSDTYGAAADLDMGYGQSADSVYGI